MVINVYANNNYLMDLKIKYSENNGYDLVTIVTNLKWDIFRFNSN